jgi:purine-binding chemotaxis protein CheW
MNNQEQDIEFIRFNLNPKEEYGIPYPYVQEIVHNVPIESPPFVPPFVAGVINWQGLLSTVVDLNKFFHPKQSKRRDGYIIIINAHDITLGLLVNHVEGSEAYQPSQLSVPLSSARVINPEYILGLHRAVTAILHIEALVTGLSQEIKGEAHGSYD